MSGIRRYFEEGAVYFITTVTRDRKTVFRDRKYCRILLITVEYYKIIFDYLILGYCLMPDHFHLILKPGPKFNVGVIMKMVKGSFSRKVNKLESRQGSLWQPRYYDEVIRDEKQLTAQLRYMHQNPVAAGLVSSAEKYVFSSHNQYENIPNPDGSILEIDRIDSD